MFDLFGNASTFDVVSNVVTIVGALIAVVYGFFQVRKIRVETRIKEFELEDIQAARKAIEEATSIAEQTRLANCAVDRISRLDRRVHGGHSSRTTALAFAFLFLVSYISAAISVVYCINIDADRIFFSFASISVLFFMAAWIARAALTLELDSHNELLLLEVENSRALAMKGKEEGEKNASRLRELEDSIANLS